MKTDVRLGLPYNFFWKLRSKKMIESHITSDKDQLEEFMKIMYVAKDMSLILKGPIQILEVLKCYILRREADSGY